MKVVFKNETVDRKDFKTEEEFIAKVTEADMETFRSLANK